MWPRIERTDSRRRAFLSGYGVPLAAVAVDHVTRQVATALPVEARRRKIEKIFDCSTVFSTIIELYRTDPNINQAIPGRVSHT